MSKAETAATRLLGLINMTFILLEWLQVSHSLVSIQNYSTLVCLVNVLKAEPHAPRHFSSPVLNNATAT